MAAEAHPINIKPVESGGAGGSEKNPGQESARDLQLVKFPSRKKFIEQFGALDVSHGLPKDAAGKPIEAVPFARKSENAALDILDYHPVDGQVRVYIHSPYPTGIEGLDQTGELPDGLTPGDQWVSYAQFQKLVESYDSIPYQEEKLKDRWTLGKKYIDDHGRIIVVARYESAKKKAGKVITPARVVIFEESDGLEKQMPLNDAKLYIQGKQSEGYQEFHTQKELTSQFHQEFGPAGTILNVAGDTIEIGGYKKDLDTNRFLVTVKRNDQKEKITLRQLRDLAIQADQPGSVDPQKEASEIEQAEKMETFLQNNQLAEDLDEEQGRRMEAYMRHHQPKMEDLDQQEGERMEEFLHNNQLVDDPERKQRDRMEAFLQDNNHQQETKASASTEQEQGPVSQVEFLRQRMEEKKQRMLQARRHQVEAKSGLGKLDKLLGYFKLSRTEGTARHEYLAKQKEFLAAEKEFRSAYDEYCRVIYHEKRDQLHRQGLQKGDLDFSLALVDFVAAEKVVDVTGADGQTEKKSIIQYMNDIQFEVDSIRMDRLDSQDRNLALRLFDKYRSMPRSQRVTLSVLMASGVGFIAAAAGGTAASLAAGYGLWRGAKSLGRTLFGGAMAGSVSEYLKARHERENRDRETQLHREMIQGYREGRFSVADLVVKFNQEKSRQDRNRLIAAGIVAGGAAFGLSYWETALAAPKPSGVEIPTNQPVRADGTPVASVVDRPNSNVPRPPGSNISQEMAGPNPTDKTAKPLPEVEKIIAKGDVQPKVSEENAPPRPPSSNLEGKQTSVASTDKTVPEGQRPRPLRRPPMRPTAEPPQTKAETKQLFQQKLSRGDSVWDHLKKYYQGDERATAKQIVEFKKNTLRQLVEKNGLDRTQAGQYIEWKFGHLDPGDQILIDAKGRMQVSGFTDPDDIKRFSQTRLGSTVDQPAPAKRPKVTPMDEYDRRIEKARQEGEYWKDQADKAKAEARFHQQQAQLTGSDRFIRQVDRIKGLGKGDMRLRVGDLLKEKSFRLTDQQADVHWRSGQGVGLPGADRFYTYGDFQKHRQLAQAISRYVKGHPELLSQGILDQRVGQFLDQVQQDR